MIEHKIQDQRIAQEEIAKQRAEIERIRQDILRPLPTLNLGGILVVVLIVVVLVWSNRGVDASPAEFVQGVPTLINFVVKLFPVEFEYLDGSERAISWSNLGGRPVERVKKAERRARASEEEIANLADGQTLHYVLRLTGGDDASVITPEEAANYNKEEVHTLRAYIAEPGYTIVLDEWDESVLMVEEGKRAINAVPFGDNERVDSNRYVVQKNEIVIGYPIILDSVVETVQMAIIGTVATILLSIPLALLAARNVSPHPAIYQITRLILNMLRTIPPLIWALIMVSAVGLGPFAGVLALVIGSIGYNAHLFADSFEQIDPNQVAAVRATGANAIQVFNFAVLPQAFPLLASYSLITFEGNIRASTILGLVGAGGIGFIIQKYTALYQFNRLMGAVVLLMIVVTAIDRSSNQLRKWII